MENFVQLYFYAFSKQWTVVKYELREKRATGKPLEKVAVEFPLKSK